MSAEFWVRRRVQAIGAVVCRVAVAMLVGSAVAVIAASTGGTNSIMAFGTTSELTPRSAVRTPQWAALPMVVAPQTTPYAGPVVDAHAHLEAESGVSAEVLLALYDEVGVRGAWLFGYPWSLAAEAAQRSPSRFVPFLAEGYRATVAPGSAYLDAPGLEALLARRAVRGLGEVILRHSAFRLGPSGGNYAAPAVEVPADHPALLDAYAVAGRHGAPVVVHQEAAFAGELERALQAAPDTTFVWAHAGHGPAGTLRALLGRYPNLHADLSARTPWIGAGTMLTEADGGLRPEWAALLAEYSDRLLIGLDLFVPAHFRAPYVRDTMQYYRGLLGRLDPAAAERIAYRNAERLAPFAASATP